MWSSFGRSFIGSTAGLLATAKKMKAEADVGNGGYLAVFVARYEYNMGNEHAQFPSGNYTDNKRTDVLYYALSRDGVKYQALNRDRAVYYPDNMKQLGSPSLFKKADGTYGLIASDNNKSSKIILSDSNIKCYVAYSGVAYKNAEKSVIPKSIVLAGKR